MTIPSEISRTDALGNGVASVYPYTFRIVKQEDLLVTVRDTSGAESTLVLTTDYTVSGAGSSSGGSITLVDAGQGWLQLGKLKTGYAITIRRVVDLLQETDIRNQGDFYPEAHEDEFDHLMTIAQQQQDAIDRAIKLPETVSGSTFNGDLPAILPEMPGYTIVVNGAGDGWSLGPSADLIASAQAFATAAQDAQDAAEDAQQSAADAAASAAQAANVALGGVNTTVTRYSGDGVEVDFTLPSDPGSENNTFVYIEGVYQQKDTYSVSGTSLTFSVAPPAGTDNIEVVTGKVLDIGEPSNDTVSTAKLQDDAVSTDKLQDGSVTNAKLADEAVDLNKILESARKQLAIYAGDSNNASNDYTVFAIPAFTSYSVGMTVMFRADWTNTGNATLNVNGLGVKGLLDEFGNNLNPQSISELQPVVAVYDGDNFRCVGLRNPPRDIYEAHTFSAFGSTNNKIPILSTEVTNIGSAITKASSAANGDSYTINLAGVYSITLSAPSSAACVYGLSVNSSQLTTNIETINVANRLAVAYSGNASGADTMSVTRYFFAGDVIRIHTSGNAGATASYLKIYIIRIH